MKADPADCMEGLWGFDEFPPVPGELLCETRDVLLVHLPFPPTPLLFLLPWPLLKCLHMETLRLLLSTALRSAHAC